MKKINIMAAALVGLLAFASCDADRDDNPIMSVPESFNLLKPEMGDNIIDLKSSEYVQFKAEKAADYGFPTETSYWIQIAGEDNADFKNKKRIFSTSTKGNSITYNAPANEFDLCVMKVKGWEEESQVVTDQPITLNVRMVSCPKNLNDSANYVYTNVQQVKIYPYFIKESLPQFWYLTGGIIADASWNNDPSKIGIGMMPMYVKEGESYDKFTGDGIVQYTGYLKAGEFKIIAPKGLTNWNYGIGGGNITKDGGEDFKYRDGGDDTGNLVVADPGYYVLEVNTKEHKLKVSPYNADYKYYKGEVVDYTTMKIGDTEMSPITTIDGVPNHDWYAEITLSAKTEMSFTSGEATWGSSIFPCAIGNKDDGVSIPCDKGTYKVYFNDISGAYSFVEQK